MLIQGVKVKIPLLREYGLSACSCDAVLQFFFPSPHEAAVFPSAGVAKKHVYFSIRTSSSLLKCLILMVASVASRKSDSKVTPGHPSKRPKTTQK